MYRFFLPFVVASTMTLPVLAQTPECDNVVVDNAHVISDAGRVEAAARQLGNAGATVRVRTIGDTVPTSSLDDYMKRYRDRCSTWRSGDQWRSTMVVFAFAPNVGNQVGVYYGPSNAGKIGDSKWKDVLRTNFNPQLQAYDHGDKAALTEGFANSLTEFAALVSRPSTGGNVVINQATDHRGLWKVLGWLVVGLFAFGILLAVWLYIAARGRQRAAQAEARRVRSECVSGILEITDDTDHVVLQASIDTQPDDIHETLKRKMVQYKNYGDKALGSFSRFDSMSSRDPLEADMPIEGYRNLQARYEGIVENYVNPARRLRQEIEAGDTARPLRFQTYEEYDRERTADRAAKGLPPLNSGISNTQPAPLQPQPSPTVIVQGGSSNDGFVTGMFLGDAMARASDAEAELRAERRRRRDDDTPPPTSYSGDSSSSSNSSNGSGSSDSGGSFSVDTSSSSDSGGSFSSSSSC